MTIQRNESYANRTGGLADGGGFDFDQSVSNSLLQFNYSHDNDGNGYMLAHGVDTAAHVGNVIRYNVSQNDGRKNGTSSIHVFGRITSGRSYQNTVSLSATSSGAKVVRVDGRQPHRAVHLRNNIFRTKGGATLLQVSSAAVSGVTDLRFQGNDWYAAGATPKFVWGTVTYTSLAGWRTGTGAEKVGGNPVGTSVDPQFVGGDARRRSPIRPASPPYATTTAWRSPRRSSTRASTSRPSASRRARSTSPAARVPPARPPTREPSSSSRSEPGRSPQSERRNAT